MSLSLTQLLICRYKILVRNMMKQMIILHHGKRGPLKIFGRGKMMTGFLIIIGILKLMIKSMLGGQGIMWILMGYFINSLCLWIVPFTRSVFVIIVSIIFTRQKKIKYFMLNFPRILKANI